MSKNRDELEKNSLGGKIARYGRVSGTMAGLAARLAGERYLGLKIEREEHAQKLVEALGNLKGPLMKVGQILATIPEALPPEYARTFQQLQSNAPPMGWLFVKRRMKAELGADWERKFETFEKEAAAAASLGQVHKATDHKNRALACKLQYPDMQSAIEADLNQLKIIFSIYERYDKAIQTRQIHQELAERLKEELDYDLEARHCKLYAYMLRNEKNVHVPEVVDELSTVRLLTSTWLEGDKILNYKDADTETRNAIALNMFRAWYVPLYNYGVIHGDPHLGNYTIRKDLSVNLLDFGCVRVFPAKFVGGVINLYNALMNNDNDLAVHAYETWGFNNLSKEQVETLNIWANFLYGPVMEDTIRPIGEITNGVYGRETAETVHKKLREVGGVNVPREFVFMDRAALGLGSVFLHLKAEINWYRLFNELIEGFDENRLAKKQKDALDKFEIPLQH
ncbi:MAG: AarF/ABC1/UbiB kinase family protein [Alphaproteobacteria bacterium]|nr:AarF/ABC1/UbiB kinase family protein [Alphaproteobacteria bacterium]